MLKNLAITLLTLALTSVALAQKGSSASAGADAKAEVQKAEMQWNDCILHRDVDCAASFLTENYFLMIDIEGQPLLKAPRELWLKGLLGYFIESMSIDETDISLHADVAVVTSRYS